MCSRALAMVSTAVFDAVNSIDGRYQSYSGVPAVSPLASVDAAVANAELETSSSACSPHVSLYLMPHWPLRWQRSLSAHQQPMVSTPAARLPQVFLRSGRPMENAPSTYLPSGLPGAWTPTAPAFAAAVLPQWGGVKPWTMTIGSQFRPVAPPAITTTEYSSAFALIRQLGALDSTTRNADQTATAFFWAGGAGTATPPGQWNMIAQTVAVQQDLSTPEASRMYALLNMALADAAIVAWDAKYVYDYWRPITAIQNGNTDGNAGTPGDPAWQPLINTPPFPSYTSGHSTFSSAAAAVLSAFYGTDTISFTAKSEAVGVADRTFRSFTAAANEAGMSRIYGGIHFGFDNKAGLTSGRALGNWVASRMIPMQPSASIVNGTLRVFGSNGLDNIAVNSGPSGISVVVNRVALFSTPATAVTSIFVDAGSGNDLVTIAAGLQISAELNGGAGNDRLIGGGRP
jgi:membrane-associated phospholipid phosphatase